MTATTISLTIMQHNDKRFLFDLVDSIGDEVPLTSYQELIFSVALDINSTSFIDKRLSRGEILLEDSNSFYVDINHEESGATPPGSYYCEIKGITPTNLWQTLAIGTFAITDTQIGDYLP